MKRKMTKLFLQCGLGLAAVLGLLLCNSAKATLFWTADTSQGTSVFEGLEESPGTIGVATDPLGKFGSVYKYAMPDEPTSFGKERDESRGCRVNGTNFRPQYNHEYYIGWRAMWNPMPIDPGWVALWQMHGYGVSGQGAPLVLRAINGDGNLYMQANANGVNVDFWHMPFKLNTWQGFVVHVFLSTNASQGYVELWVDGVKQTFINGSQKYFVPTWDNVDGKWQDSYNLFKWGVYRSGAMDGKGPATAYMSNAKVGDTYTDVDPGIGGSGGGATLDTTGIYQIQNVASGLVLNNQGSLTNGSKITQWSSASTSQNLQWKFIATSGSYYQINSVKSGLDAVVQSASTASGAGIIQFQFGSAGNDQWKPVQNSDGSITFYNLHSGLVLEDPGNSTSTSTQMDQWTANGGNNQRWKLIKQ
jgi:Ricin-type beta-trefoil lectin domain-like